MYEFTEAIRLRSHRPRKVLTNEYAGFSLEGQSCIHNARLNCNENKSSKNDISSKPADYHHGPPISSSAKYILCVCLCGGSLYKKTKRRAPPPKEKCLKK